MRTIPTQTIPTHPIPPSGYLSHCCFMEKRGLLAKEMKNARWHFQTHTYGGVAVINSTSCPSPGPGEVTPRLDRLMPMDCDLVATGRWLSDLDLRERFLTLPDYLQYLQLMRLGIVPVDAWICP